MESSPSSPPPPSRDASSTRRAALGFGLVMVVVIVLVVVLAGGGEDEAASSAAGAAGCEEVTPPEREPVDLDPPPKEPSGESVAFETSCGPFTVALDAEQAPKTAAAFEYLAEQGVYDGSSFNRVAPGFVIQGGDPAGGDAGFDTVEPPPSNISYTRGLVAMAKSPVDPPGTGSGTFFIVTAPADAGLPADYALIGEVTEGMETVEKIESLGAGPGTDGPPGAPVVIESATVEG